MAQGLAKNGKWQQMAAHGTSSLESRRKAARAPALCNAVTDYTVYPVCSVQPEMHQTCIGSLGELPSGLRETAGVNSCMMLCIRIYVLLASSRHSAWAKFTWLQIHSFTTVRGALPSELLLACPHQSNHRMCRVLLAGFLTSLSRCSSRLTARHKTRNAAKQLRHPPSVSASPESVEN